MGLEAGYGVPGLFRHYDAWTVSGPAGLMIPCLTPDGLIQGFQIRSDDTAYGKYVWLSSGKFILGKFSGGTASGTFYHYTHAAMRWDVWICEGALKATVAAALTDEAFIGLPGCHLANAQAMLAPFKHPPRLILAPDADYRANGHVRRGWVNTLNQLMGLGCEVMIADWPPEAGKGIDDVLIQSGQLPRLIKPRAWVDKLKYCQLSGF